MHVNTHHTLHTLIYCGDYAYHIQFIHLTCNNKMFHQHEQTDLELKVSGVSHMVWDR